MKKDPQHTWDYLNSDQELSIAEQAQLLQHFKQIKMLDADDKKLHQAIKQSELCSRQLTEE